MEKPTIFFSHSSKDKDLILPIKEKIIDITGGVITVFMSSDGQSIPLGRNWVSKIEEGLNDAQIMFIFVTPNSIKSDWIYFEAGYAYSKGIEVIPVGIGVHIGELKAPLSLLQGFDVLSSDSMNNFISVINKKFSLSFKENFNESDYDLLCKFIFKEEIMFDISEVFSIGLYECCSQYHDPNKENDIIRYDVEKFYNNIKDYLDKNKIQYSSSDRKLLVSGIKIIVRGKEVRPKNGNIDQNHKINFYLSTYNFTESFDLFIKLFSTMKDEYVSLRLELNEAYDCIYKEEQLSSIISLTDILFYSKDSINIFRYKDSINWWIQDMSHSHLKKEDKRVLGFSFKINEADISDIIDFINCLCKTGIIYKKK